MQCLRHVSYTSWRLTVYRQLFPSALPNSSSSTSRRPISSTTSRPQAQNHQQDATGTEQAHNDIPETPAPRPSDQLPQSPLLTDPRVGPVKKHRKRPPTAKDLDNLRHNPWARTLASPLRMCCITGVRTPRDLLTTWGLVQRPDSKGLWFLPIDLLKDELSGLESPKKGQKSPPVKSAQEPQSSASPSQPRPQALQHVSVRLVGSIQLLRRLCRSLASHTIGNYSALTKIFPFRAKHPQGPLTQSHTRSLVWRQDMPVFVLGKMRVEAAKQLKKVACRKRQEVGHENGVWRAVDIEGPVSEDALRKALEGMKAFERMECGALIVMREPPSDQDAGDLPQLVTLPQTGSRVPVFDLSKLLSESTREELRKADPKFQRKGLFFRPDDDKAIDALMSLWKLQGFLNENIRFS